ncbi:MAG: S9 family peptidase, partial [Phenylobacterium sp.]
PSFSPDGARLLYLDKSRIVEVSATGDGQSHTLLTDRGGIGSLAWSSDGKRIAFVSRRGSHALVGVYDFAARSIVWLAPSLDSDGSPTFSPDGARVAFIRTAAEKRQAFITRRSGEPWSIWVADAASGRGARAWVADAGVGSVFARTLSSENLLWGAGDQLVFPWEKTGWRQLYTVSAKGGAARALTSGAFEVETLTLSPDGAHVVYTSNQDDLDRAHVWSAALGDRRITRASQDGGIQIYPSVGSDGALYALQSDATKPLQPVVLRAGHWQPLAPDAVPQDFPSQHLVTPEAVTFTAADGQLVHGQLFVPRDGAKGSRAAVLFFHGGPQRQMLLGFHPMGAYNWMYAKNQYLASKGYIVLSVNYRGGIGYGLDYREAKDFGPGGGSELNDLLGAISFLKARKDVDPRRLGIYGASYGGLMTALGLARASDDIAAGVDYAGVYNWSTMLAQTGAAPADAAAAQLAVASSPIATIDKWRSPVLIVQADDDRNVPSAQASELIIDLRRHGIAHDELMLPNEVHDMTRYASWMTLFHAADDYFERHMTGR